MKFFILMRFSLDISMSDMDTFKLNIINISIHKSFNQFFILLRIFRICVYLTMSKFDDIEHDNLEKNENLIREAIQQYIIITLWTEPLLLLSY